jgi:hypothetical protein
MEFFFFEWVRVCNKAVVLISSLEILKRKGTIAFMKVSRARVEPGSSGTTL